MQYRFLLIPLLFLISAVSGSASEPARTTYNLNSDWRFYYASQLDISDADYIALPHTWQDALGSYGNSNSSAHYIRTLNIPREWLGKRIFLRFGGVQNVAGVFVNAAFAGAHKGGFTAFNVEITNYLRYGAENLIRVVVNNDVRSDVLPISSDMDLTAGIYRDVELIVAPRNMISLEHLGTKGVFVVQESVNEEQVSGYVRCYISAQNHAHLDLTIRIIGSDGYQIESYTQRINKINNDGYVDIPFSLDNPQLWSPQSPTMYRFEISLSDDKDSDDVAVETGFRTVTFNKERRLCINNEPQVVRGVNLAHDHMGFGMAISQNNLQKDYDMLRDMGATALRSLSGPHTQSLYDWCDRDGVLAWVDMPFTRSEATFADICYYPIEEFHRNGTDQLAEIIAQNYNHPSVVLWGLFSLVWQQGDSVIDYIKVLNDKAKSLDPSRPTMGCSNMDGEINFITDAVALRQTVGWQKGLADDVAVWCRQLDSKREWRTYNFGVCYGEEGVLEHNTERIVRAHRGTRNLPARRQTYMHERYWSIIDSMGDFWGIWLNSMFDYASSRRPYHLNRSGMVGYDHKTKKDVFYLYRAVWNDSEPTIHITEGDWQSRTDTIQHFTVYSSVGMPLLLVNGDSVTMTRISRGIYRADSVVIKGRANIEAIDSTATYRHKIDINCGGLLSL